ncbi:TniB family NTP-binding protein [Phormidium sp. FACHB-592]|uniref:TniB family NTP-binding protein n=1 Tax=Stenomitos frigidus AS-A4 TaxID=2933935 RepID=A0ABV0KMY6_9CYAN|nr:TniB family NTP-binding protein [Phormidium sp. FACHB-592]MBD2074357.1 TniB family NTP-binding protein [Phormidium sp. FACHB-592]
MVQAKEWAEVLGEFQPTEAQLKAETDRLRKKTIMPLEQVSRFHNWLDGKRKSRQSCRVVGESRTGKSMACEAYFYRHKPQQEPGKKPIVPVVYIQPPQKCGAKDLFKEIIEFLKHRATKGTISDFRGRAMEILQACEVEILIIDEADRLKPETFADVRDIYDKLAISVVLVGTDRLDAVIKCDEQVYNRFRACHRFGKLSGEEFVKTVAIWEQKILKLPVASNLTSKEMLRIVTAGTEGYIGRMDEILREAAIRSLSAGFKKVEKKILEEVAKEYK